MVYVQHSWWQIVLCVQTKCCESQQADNGKWERMKDNPTYVVSDT